MSKRLIIEQIARTKSDGGIEKLEFTDGVNAIVGPQNTGKSTWLRMLDFLMADDGTPKGTFDEVLTEKYQAISSLMRFGSSVVEVERTWSGDGTRSQMLLNGDRIRIEDAQNIFLEALNIPTLRYPQGNIYASDRTWPTLGWRSLLRHIYRRQDLERACPEAARQRATCVHVAISRPCRTSVLVRSVAADRQEEEIGEP